MTIAKILDIITWLILAYVAYALVCVIKSIIYYVKNPHPRKALVKKKSQCENEEELTISDNISEIKEI